MKEGSEHTPEGAIPFLLGSGTLEGYWFGEKPTDRPPYWWRKHLREYDAQLLEENKALKEALRQLHLEQDKHKLAHVEIVTPLLERIKTLEKQLDDLKYERPLLIKRIEIQDEKLRNLEQNANQWREENEKMKEVVKKYCYHWDSFFGNPKVGQPPSIWELKDLFSPKTPDK